MEYQLMIEIQPYWTKDDKAPIACVYVVRGVLYYDYDCHTYVVHMYIYT